MEANEKMPLAIVILGWAAIVYALIQFNWLRTHIPSGGVHSVQFLVAILLEGAFRVLYLAAGIGLLMLSRWGRTFTLIVAGISIVTSLINQQSGAVLLVNRAHIVLYYFVLLLSFGIHGFAIWYLLQSRVKHMFYFKRRS